MAEAHRPVCGAKDRPGGSPVTDLIDTHTHLNHPRLFRRLAQVLQRAGEAGVTEMIVVGYDLPSSEAAVALAERHQGSEAICRLWAAVGVHPHDASGFCERALTRLRSLTGSKVVVAIGETGLDFYRDLSPREAQIEALQRHLTLAEEVGLPAILHCRAAQEPLLDLLARRKPSKLIWHCFDGSRDHAARALNLGMALGFGGMVTYRTAEELRRIAAEAPADRILLETDCPYLAPEPHRGRDNEPANLPIIAECVAQARGASRRQVETLAAQNARTVFCIRESSA